MISTSRLYNLKVTGLAEGLSRFLRFLRKTGEEKVENKMKHLFSQTEVQDGMEMVFYKYSITIFYEYHRNSPKCENHSKYLPDKFRKPGFVMKSGPRGRATQSFI